MNVDDLFRDNLRAEISRRGTNPSELSLRAGLNRRAVADILSGTSKSPKLSTVHALAETLDLSIEDLVFGADRPKVSSDIIEMLSRYNHNQQRQILATFLSLLQPSEGPEEAP